MVDKRRRDPDRTRLGLLEAGAEVFARRGYGGARTRAIADRAGVNKAMISYHFGGKRGLYEAVVEHLVDASRSRLADLRTDRDRPAPERLRELVRVMGESFRRRPELGAIVLREHLAGGVRLSPEVMRSHIGEFFATSRAIVEDGARRRELRPVDPHAFHLSLVGALAFFLVSQPYRDRAASEGELQAPAPSFDDYIEHLGRLLLDGLRPDAEAREAQPRRRS